MNTQNKNDYISTQEEHLQLGYSLFSLCFIVRMMISFGQHNPAWSFLILIPIYLFFKYILRDAKKYPLAQKI